MFAVGTRSNVTVPFTVTAGPVGGGVLSPPPWWQPTSRSITNVAAARRRATLEVILFLRSELRSTCLDNARGANSMTRPTIENPRARAAGGLRALLGRATLRPVRGRPAGRLRVGQVEQNGLNFLDVAVAHGEELRNEAIVARGHALALRAAL